MNASDNLALALSDIAQRLGAAGFRASCAPNDDADAADLALRQLMREAYSLRDAIVDIGARLTLEREAARRVAESRDDLARELRACIPFLQAATLRDAGAKNRRDSAARAICAYDETSAPGAAGPRFIVDGRTSTDPEAESQADGTSPPFTVFDVRRQRDARQMIGETSRPATFTTRRTAQAVADVLNGDDDGRNPCASTLRAILSDVDAPGGTVHRITSAPLTAARLALYSI